MNSIIVDSISKTFGDKAVVDSLTFNVKKGSIHGFLGPNGAGKTTTMRMISGVIPPNSGNIYINGNNVQQHLLKIKKSLGVLLEIPPLLKEMEVEDYLSFVCRLHGVKKNDVRELVENSLIKLDLLSVKNRLIGNLSKGFKQRVGVAQAIVYQPEIILLDEPTIGLDPSSVIEMRELIKELGKNHTVLLSSHLLHEVGLICDEVTIISGGHLQASGPMKEIAQKVNQKQRVHLKVKRWSTDVQEKMQQLDFVQQIEIFTKENSYEVEVILNSVADERETLSDFVFKNQLGLIEFFQEKLDLEKIFLEYTSSGGHS